MPKFKKKSLSEKKNKALEPSTLKENTTDLKILKRKNIRQRIKELRELIKKHDHYYYNLDQPEISDREYDRLFEELIKLEKEMPSLITPDSPSQRVPGKALSHFKKAEHKKPMLSLKNTYNQEEIISFYEKSLNMLNSSEVEFLLEPKLDGVAINLLYEKGLLRKALTRGDGLTGENVLENIKTIHSIPLKIPKESKTLEIRGEVILLKEDFKKINENQLEQGLSFFANPRNMASGSIRQLDPTVTAQRPLKFFAHSPGFLEDINSTQSLFLKELKSLGFPVFPVMSLKEFQVESQKSKTFTASVLARNKVEILKYFQLMEKRKLDLPFEIDGIVIKVNSFLEQEKMGVISRSPRFARAAKFEPERGNTIVKNILIQVGRTGVLTPLAHLKPVRIGGVTITHATLHNQAEIKKKDIRVGDEVIIGRAGDVIPEVIKVDFSKRKKNLEAFKMPDICPSCSYKVDTTKDIVFCENPLCKAQALKSLIHFTSKKAMNIESLGKKLMEKLYEEKQVQKFSDIYQLTKKKLLSLKRMGEKSSERILSSIEKSKKTNLKAFVFSLGIRHIGEQTALGLSNFFLKNLYTKTIDTQNLDTKPDTQNLDTKKEKRFFFKVFKAFYDLKNKFFKTKVFKVFCGFKIKIFKTKTTKNRLLNTLKNSKNPGEKALGLLISAKEETLKQIPDIGDVSVKSLQESFERKSLLKEIELLLSLGVKILQPKEMFTGSIFTDKKLADKNFADNSFAGKKIVITGSLPLSREKIEKLIYLLEGRVQSSVNKKTNFLLMGESLDGKTSKKLKKAQELNIPILDWDTFQKQIDHQ